MTADRRAGSSPPTRGIAWPRDARELAYVVLGDYRRTQKFVPQIFEAFDARNPGFPSDERRRAVELVYGSVRRQATLDALILPQMRRPRDRIEEGLWTLLQLGTYQALFLNAVPQYAAVNETVSLAKRVGNRGWDSFVNGALRNVLRSVMEDFTEQPAADAFPLPSGRYRRLAAALFADPVAEPALYFADAFSFPQWLSQRWAARVDLAELCRLGFWLNAVAPLYLRVNLLRATRESVLIQLAARGVACRPGTLEESIECEGTLRIDSLPGFAEGQFSVQDQTAMEAVHRLDPLPGERMLDLCAAPGSKTMHLAERMRNQGAVIACDVAAERLRGVEQNSRRLGVSIVQSRLIGRDGHHLPEGPFDAVLVDVPCSNTGVLGKRPDARWRIRLADVVELAAIQRRLLAAACGRLRPGGRVLYSTCSIEPEENQEVVHFQLQADSSMTLVAERLFWPGLPADGGYQALLRRT